MTGWFQPTHLTGQLVYQGMETEIPLGRELYIVRVKKVMRKVTVEKITGMENNLILPIIPSQTSKSHEVITKQIKG